MHFPQDDVCIETEEGLKRCKLIAVHAGLERGKNVQEQLELLKSRDSRVPKVKNLSGRKDIWDIPKVMLGTSFDIVFLWACTELMFNILC